MLAPLLFNLSVTDLPTTTFRRFLYADDIALESQHTNMTALEQTVSEQALSQDLELLVKYCRKFHLTACILKTETASSYFNNSFAEILPQVS